MELPYGATVESVPGVVYTAAENASVDTSRAASLPGATTLVVTSQDGANSVTYTINFTIGAETLKVMMPHFLLYR